jgi:hypothetical protein
MFAAIRTFELQRVLGGRMHDKHRELRDVKKVPNKEYLQETGSRINPDRTGRAPNDDRAPVSCRVHFSKDKKISIFCTRLYTGRQQVRNATRRPVRRMFQHLSGGQKNGG